MTGYIAIINPAAGGGRSGREGPSALRSLREAGVALDDIRYTRAAGDAQRIAKDAWQQGARRFLVVGGDGTTHEVINGCVPEALSGEERPTIAMLPLGTGNSFLRDFGIVDAKGALAAIRKGTSRSSDVVRLDHQDGALLSFNIVGLGFSATVGARTNARYKRFGVAGYVVAVFETAMNLQAPVFPLRLDGGELDSRPTTLLSFSNSRFTGGAMEMAPRAKVDDGELDVIRISDMPRLQFVAQFPSIFRGTHTEKNVVEEKRARRVDFEIPEVIDCMIDGEIVRVRPRAVEVVPRAFSVVA
jgi:YegS/Rv2252/BmrU family lipid kinase